MKQTLKAFARRPEHKNLDSCVVCVLIHGENCELCGVDGKTVSVPECMSYFNREKCPGMAGKPKIFILEACRGGELFSFFFLRLSLQFWISNTVFAENWGPFRWEEMLNCIVVENFCDFILAFILYFRKNPLLQTVMIKELSLISRMVRFRAVSSGSRQRPDLRVLMPQLSSCFFIFSLLLVLFLYQLLDKAFRDVQCASHSLFLVFRSYCGLVSKRRWI